MGGCTRVLVAIVVVAWVTDCGSSRGSPALEGYCDSDEDCRQMGNFCSCSLPAHVCFDTCEVFEAPVDAPGEL